MMDKLDPKLPTMMMFLLAFTMVLYGLVLIFVKFEETYEGWALLCPLSGLQIAAAGIIIIVDPGRNYLRSVVLFAISLGLFRFVSYLAKFKVSIESGGSMIPYEMIMAAAYLFLSIIGLLMLITAAAIQMGFAFRRNSLLISCIIGVQSQFIRMVLISVIYDDDGTSMFMDQMFYRCAIEFVVFIIVIYLFDSDQVRNGSTWGKHSVRITAIRNGRITDVNSYIEPEDVGQLADPTLTDWKTMMDCGPVEKEYTFKIHGKNQSVSEVIIQRWKGDPRYHMTIQGSLDTQILHANRVIVDSIYISNKRINFAGKDGTSISFGIRYGSPDDLFGYEVSKV